jgi:hypothetical protein
MVLERDSSREIVMAQTSRRASERSAAWGSLAFYSLESDPESEQHLVVVEDIGAGGLLLVTSDPPPVGAVLRLLIYSQSGPAGGAAVKARAIVRWHRLSPPPKGMGVQILASLESNEPSLGAWLATWPKRASERALPDWLDIDAPA